MTQPDLFPPVTCQSATSRVEPLIAPGCHDEICPKCGHYFETDIPEV